LPAGKVSQKRARRKAGKVIAQQAKPGTHLASRAQVALVIGALPNRSWGTGPGAAPPSAGS
jgi:hypothetical protein